MLRTAHLAALLLFASLPARADFVFASVEQAAKILGARDDYVLATSPLERMAKLRSGEPVDGERFIAFMAGSALAWDDADRRRLEPLLAPLDRYLAGLRWKPTQPILLIKAANRLEEGLPHTRANAIVLPEGALRDASAGALAYFLAHEVFHVMSRDDAALREQLYAAIGFRPCAKMEVPRPLGNLRITNPDAPLSRHTIRVRWRGQEVEAVPYVRFSSADVDPRGGFKGQLRASWLLVERALDGCRMRAPAEGVPVEELDGLAQQIGNNTRYVIHPEEVLADNFALLYFSAQGGRPRVASPEVLERIDRILRRAQGT